MWCFFLTYIIMCSTLSAFMVFPLWLVFINLIMICFGIILCVYVCVCVCVYLPEFHWATWLCDFMVLIKFGGKKKTWLLKNCFSLLSFWDSNHISIALLETLQKSLSKPPLFFSFPVLLRYRHVSCVSLRLQCDDLICAYTAKWLPQQG